VKFILSLVISCLSLSAASAATKGGRDVRAERPADFVDVTSIEPSFRVEMMYFGSDNFVGRPIDGYGANRCFLAKEPAEALKEAQGKVRAAGRRVNKEYSLVLKDCYRPHRATQDFLSWSEDGSDLKQREKFYPGLTKAEILSDGYLSSFSGHSRGSTTDLTIAEKEADGTWKNLDMGGPVDFFGEVSHANFGKISAEAKRNRRMLEKAMAPAFQGYDKEWWHFTFKPEPYPKTAFDFPIEEEGK